MPLSIARETRTGCVSSTELRGNEPCFPNSRPSSPAGNVLDLAVAVIIGAAFATITKSLTDDLIMPVVGAIFGGLDFASYFIVLGPIPEGFGGNPASYADLKAAGIPVLGWGQFITVLINFLILAFVIFLHRSQRHQDDEARRRGPAGPTEVDLLTEIRDELGSASARDLLKAGPASPGSCRMPGRRPNGPGVRPDGRPARPRYCWSGFRRR